MRGAPLEYWLWLWKRTFIWSMIYISASYEEIVKGFVTYNYEVLYIENDTYNSYIITLCYNLVCNNHKYAQYSSLHDHNYGINVPIMIISTTWKYFFILFLNEGFYNHYDHYILRITLQDTVHEPLSQIIIMYADWRSPFYLRIRQRCFMTPSPGAQVQCSYCDDKLAVQEYYMEIL